jgi:SAM-dependent methyltransferase
VEHFYRTIPGWFSFRALYERAVREAPDGAHFVEVGCWKGRSAAFMAVEILNSGKQIRFDCVDHWQGSQEPKHLADPDVQSGALFEAFLKNISPVRDRITIYKMPSVFAAADHPDGSLDFVFIDGAHDYQHVRDDIAAWWPKVRPGGSIAGDDYRFKGVMAAVEEAFPDGFEIISGTGTGIQWQRKK